MVLSFSSLLFLKFEILPPFQRQDKIPESKSVAQGTRTRLPSLNTKENTEQTGLVWEYLQEKIYQSRCQPFSADRQRHGRSEIHRGVVTHSPPLITVGSAGR